ncbi:MAG: ABC transporter ATP-binding protein [Clostridium sp.]|nr:ABC transporter ATP-binding protein [Clostridium sp.]
MLKLTNVSKYFNGVKVLKNINLEVKDGEIFGFLGPNGAGKSTTMKIICGLLSPDEGTVCIDNKDIVKSRNSALSELSALIESPKMYPYLSAVENLKQICRLDDIPISEISEIIDLVGLKGKENDKVKNYSLGMKQRLGIAQVIMGNKKLWILDEPTNGLDANGVIEFRNMLRKLRQEKGVTIFISSHKLDEMQKICDKVAFIHSGEIKCIEYINQNTKNCSLKIFTNDSQKCFTIFEKLDYIEKVEKFELGIKLKYENEHFNDILIELVNNKINVTNICKEQETLEERYLNIIGGVQND